MDFIAFAFAFGFGAIAMQSFGKSWAWKLVFMVVVLVGNKDNAKTYGLDLAWFPQKSLWSILVNFGQFWLTLVNFGQFWSKAWFDQSWPKLTKIDQTWICALNFWFGFEMKRNGVYLLGFLWTKSGYFGVLNDFPF